MQSRLSSQEIRIFILRYLAKRPDAQDTLEGVTDWWIQQERIEWSMEHVKRALDALVSEDLLIEKCVRCARPIYALNKERRDEIRSFLLENGERP